MTFSIAWVVLATTVILIAISRKAGLDPVQGKQEQGEIQIGQTGKVMTLAGIIYSMVLLAGFLYIGWQHGLELVK